jgi:hypothetical protein
MRKLLMRGEGGENPIYPAVKIAGERRVIYARISILTALLYLCPSLGRVEEVGLATPQGKGEFYPFGVDDIKKVLRLGRAIKKMITNPKAAERVLKKNPFLTEPFAVGIVQSFFPELWRDAGKWTVRFGTAEEVNEYAEYLNKGWVKSRARELKRGKGRWLIRVVDSFLPEEGEDFIEVSILQPKECRDS